MNRPGLTETLDTRRLLAKDQALTDDHNSDMPQVNRVEEVPPKIRVSIDISPELYAKLQNLSRDIRGTKSDVIRKSLALMDVAVQARKNGKKIGIAEQSEQLSTEIIGFEY